MKLACTATAHALASTAYGIGISQRWALRDDLTRTASNLPGEENCG